MPPRNLLLLCLLLQALTCLGQRLPGSSWVKRLEKANAAAESIREGRERLEKASAVLRDSASLQRALDSLRVMVPDSAMLAQKKDSLLQEFSAQRLGEWAQREAEQELQRELDAARAAASKDLLPKHARELLRQAEGKLNPEGIKEVARGLPDKLLSSSPERFKEAQVAMNKYKDRYDKVESLKEMPKGYFRQNALRGRPWPEHLELGTLWQFGKQERYNLDLAPTVAWRLTDMLSLGAGFQYRLSVDAWDKAAPGASGAVLGPLLFADHRIKKGFFGRLHYEHLNAPITTLDLAKEKGREWVPGLSVGLGKEFGLWGSLQGFLLTQYNVLHKGGKTPYLSPFQIRLGLYLKGLRLFGKER